DFINSVEIISGSNDKINNLTDLQFDDDNTYDITGEWTGFQWEYEIYFSYEINLTRYQLDYYDIYLFLDIKQPSIPSGVLEFQTYSSYNYTNLINIFNHPIRIEAHLLERTTKFRLIGNTDLEKIIKIDRMALILAHEGFFNYTTQVSFSTLENINLYVTHPPPRIAYLVFDPLWFVAAVKDEDYTYTSSSCMNTVVFGIGAASIILDIRMYMDFDFSGGTMTNINSGEFAIKHFWDITTEHSISSSGLNNLYIRWNNPLNWDPRVLRFVSDPPTDFNLERTDVLGNSSYFNMYWDR
ncbi:unnamed protein product, partial [marine sediment metagenome]